MNLLFQQNKSSHQQNYSDPFPIKYVNKSIRNLAKKIQLINKGKQIQFEFNHSSQKYPSNLKIKKSFSCFNCNPKFQNKFNPTKFEKKIDNKFNSNLKNDKVISPKQANQIKILQNKNKQNINSYMQQLLTTIKKQRHYRNFPSYYHNKRQFVQKLRKQKCQSSFYSNRKSNKINLPNIIEKHQNIKGIWNKIQGWENFQQQIQ